MLNKTLIDLPFTGGLNKYAEEALRSGANELTNIVFEEDGIIKKHTGDEVFSTQTENIEELYQKNGNIIPVSGIITSDSGKKYDVNEITDSKKMPMTCSSSWGVFVENVFYKNNGEKLELINISPAVNVQNMYLYNDKFYCVDSNARALYSIGSDLLFVEEIASLWPSANDSDVRWDFKDGLLILVRLFDGANPMGPSNSLYIEFKNLDTANSGSSEILFLPYNDYKDWKVRVLRDFKNADYFNFGLLLSKNNAPFMPLDKSLFVAQYSPTSIGSSELQLNEVCDFEPVINAPAINWYDYSFVYRYYPAFDTGIQIRPPSFKLYSTVISYADLFGSLSNNVLCSPIMLVSCPFYLNEKLYFYAKAIDGIGVIRDPAPPGAPYVIDPTTYCIGSNSFFYDPSSNFNYVQNSNMGTLANLLNGPVYLFENFKPVLKVTSINNVFQINTELPRPTELQIILPYATDADSYYCKEYMVGNYRPKVQQINDDSIFSNGSVKINNDSMIILNRVPCFFKVATTGGTQKKYRYKVIPYYNDTSGFEYWGESVSYYEFISNIAGPIEITVFPYSKDCQYLLYRTDPIDVGSSFDNTEQYYRISKTTDQDWQKVNDIYFYNDYLAPHTDGARSVLPTDFFPITMPSFKDTVIYKNKMVGIDNDNPSRIFFSKNIINGTGPQFISTAYIYFNESVNGSVQYPTALAVLDNKLIIFTQDATYLTYGNFNDETRITSGIQNPEILTIETGCINPRSIVVSSNGITFWGKKGLYLLNRSMQAEMKNEVEFYKSEVVLDSVAILDRNEIRYYTDQRTVVWNFEFNTFSTIAEVRNSAIMLDNVIYSSFENKVLKQSNTYLSNEAIFSMKFESEWYKFKDTQNFGRISRLVLLGRKKGAHKLKISLAYDYDPTYVETHEIDNTSQAMDAIIQMRLVVKRQKCQSFRVKIEDISNGSDSLLNSIELISMTLEVGLKKGYNKLPASRKF